ncbi:MAG: hypothetical protein WCK03_02195 [Candidatus Taylorbacteria bacterium]
MSESSGLVSVGNQVPICLQSRNNIFFIKNVVDEFGDKHRKINIDLSRFLFMINATEMNNSFAELHDSFALSIEVFPILSVEFGKPILAEESVLTVQFNDLTNSLYTKGSLVPVENAIFFGQNLEARMTEEFIAQNGILKFRNDNGNHFISLQIPGRKYFEVDISSDAARLFEV